MIDASGLPFDENIALSARVAEYAHARDVTVEAEIGIIGGHEDKNTHAANQLYTNPNDAIEFVARTNVDSLAIAIGTSHGAYKRRSDSEQLRFDILGEIAHRLPNFPLVLHGASSVPKLLVDTINENGGNLNTARGIPTDQLRQAILMGICKINVDTDSRLAFTAGVRLAMSENPNEFNPRKYLGLGTSAVYENTIVEITNIMDSADRLR